MRSRSELPGPNPYDEGMRLSPERRKDLPITVLYGGISSERPGSIRFSQTVADLLTRSGYSHVQRVDITPESVLSLANRDAIGVAFMTLHGGFGEDGTLQVLLEMLDIPYTGCGVAASAISADKVLFSRFVRALGYKSAGQIVVNNAQELEGMTMEYPKVIKPATQGCSYGVFFVKDRKELLHRADFTQQFSDRMVVEDYVDGRELTVGIFEDSRLGKPRILPITENILAREILDYETKYPGGEHLYQVVLPAQIDPSVQEEIETTCVDIFKQLDCRGYVRMDLRLTKDGDIYIIENNTSPGMLNLEESVFPKMLKAGGVEPSEFVDLMVEAALLHHQNKRDSAPPSSTEMLEYLGLKPNE